MPDSTDLPAPPAPRRAAERFLGTWLLEAVHCQDERGASVALFGAAPSGIIHYAEDGLMAVQMANTDAEGSSEEEPRMAFAAYWGRYRIEADDADPDTGTAFHHIEGALVPALIGHEELRPYAFREGRLHLRFADLPVDGRMIAGEVIWRRP